MRRHTRPKVLMVGPFPPTTGGVTTFMLNLMSSDLKDDFEFIPFSTSRPPKKNVTNNWGYGSMLRGGVRRVAAGALITLLHIIQFPFVLALKRPAVIQIQASDYQTFWESGIYAALGRLLGRKVFFRIGGAFDAFFYSSGATAKRLIRFVLSIPHVVIAQSVISSQFIREAGRTGGVIVLPNWRPDDTLAIKAHSPDSPVRFLFVAGSDAHRKGIEEVIQAATLLNNTASRARFHLIAMPESLQQRVSTLELGNINENSGMAAHREILSKMRDCDVLLLPSHGEGFPNSLVEAMSVSMPSIVTPVGAVPEIVQAGGAILVPPKDSKALTQAIRDLAESLALRETLSAQAREIVQSRYTASKVLPTLASAYRRSLAGEP